MIKNVTFNFTLATFLDSNHDVNIQPQNVHCPEFNVMFCFPEQRTGNHCWVIVVSYYVYLLGIYTIPNLLNIVKCVQKSQNGSH